MPAAHMVGRKLHGGKKVKLKAPCYLCVVTADDAFMTVKSSEDV